MNSLVLWPSKHYVNAEPSIGVANDRLWEALRISINILESSSTLYEVL